MKTIYTPEQAAEECLHSSILYIFFSHPRKSVPEKKIRIRKILLKGSPYYQIETFKCNQTFHTNIKEYLIQESLPQYFSQFRAVECRGLYEHIFFAQNNKGEVTITKRIKQAASLPQESQRYQLHNKTKEYLIREGQPLPFLTAQGVMSEDGAVLKKKYHKFRQINKFLEFIADIEPFIRDYTARSAQPFSIIDFGCGKAYLSFALYYYLHERQGLPVRIHGLDLKTDVVEQCSALAAECSYKELTFTQGNIADYALPAGTGMMVCLHACDTATDLALAQAVRQDVPVIFAVPCCHHEVYHQLKSKKEMFYTTDFLLRPFMEHGIITERFASLLTDSIRALLLQAKGYTVRIMEFIETEHTPKNILIHAVKKTQSAKQERILQEEALEKYRKIKETFLIEPTLEKLLMR